MFPHEIEPIAKVAIDNEEWHCLGYLMFQLKGWMDSLDRTTAEVAARIGNALNKKLTSIDSKDTRLWSIANLLLKYALMYFEKNKQ